MHRTGTRAAEMRVWGWERLGWVRGLWERQNENGKRGERAREIMKIRTDSIMPLCVIPCMSGNIKSQTISHLGAGFGDESRDGALWCKGKETLSTFQHLLAIKTKGKIMLTLTCLVFIQYTHFMPHIHEVHKLAKGDKSCKLQWPFVKASHPWSRIVNLPQ